MAAPSCIPAISGSRTRPTRRACARRAREYSGSAEACAEVADVVEAPLLSKRLSRVAPAATVAMTIKARAMRAQGINVAQLTIGEPDFDSPRHAIEAGYQAALRGETKYPPQDGTPALKAAIQRKFKRDNGLYFA